MTILPSRTAILIVGAGPTGLALAAELRRRGADPLIIDRQPAAEHTSRACVVHARTMEVLASLGVTADLIERGVKVPIFRVRDRDHVLVTIDFSDLPSDYPFTLMCPQDQVEACLQQHLGTLGGTVSRPCDVVALVEHEDHIHVRIESDGSARTIEADWVIGCDGMHSIVRAQMGIPFVGARYDQDFVLGDVRMDWPLGAEEVTLFYSPAGLMVVAPLPGGHYRIVATVDHAPEEVTADFLQHLVAERGPICGRPQITGLAWSSRFRIHHRVAQSPRKGRVLLCGDAAHVHSPAGGQGMNTGIQDAISLASKLLAVLNCGDTACLDDWADQRHRVAADVVALTDRMTRIATIESHAGQVLRNLAVEFAGQVPALRARFARTLAELDAG